MNKKHFALRAWASILICALVFLTSSRCFALVIIETVSKEQAAKDFNATMRAQMVGTNQVGVWLEFAPKGKLKTFSSVQLEIMSGEQTLVSATLAPLKQTEDDVVIYFMTDPAHLPASKLTVFYKTSGGFPPYDGILFNVADFINNEYNGTKL
ncbi:MAG: hypothetical protein ACXWDN_01450 [Limisphaerales bacterium]